MSEEYRRKLAEYFRKNISKGYTEESLKWALIRQGYSRHDILRASEQAKKDSMKEKSAGKEKPVIKYEFFDSKNQPVKPKAGKLSSFVRFLKDLFS